MAAFSKAYLAGLLAVLTGAAVLAGCGTDSTSSGGGGGAQTIQIWEGYTAAEAKAFSHMVSEYEAQHPGQKVSPLFVNNDNTLQKVLTAVRGGSPPDIAYLYGSWAPNVAQIPQVVNLTQVVKRPSVNWNDFWTGERAVATVNGKVIGIPALVDNLAVVYNKTLFAKAGLPVPGPDWTWQDFVADAKKLTNPAIKQYGTAYVTPGTEDTVWHWEALLWEAGGQLLSADNKNAAFDSAAGLASLNTLRTMSVTDKSMYLDPSDSAYSNLFNSGKIGMLVTGPWDLSAFPQVKYWAVQTGNLPSRQSVGASAAVSQQMNAALPGVGAFIANLANVKQARPQISQYPKISTILGNMVVSVLLGKSQPQAALTAAAQQVDQALAAG